MLVVVIVVVMVVVVVVAHLRGITGNGNAAEIITVAVTPLCWRCFNAWLLVA